MKDYLAELVRQTATPYWLERLAGKLHAPLRRSHAKGRDIYDLLWNLSDPNWPQPNLVLLNNALAQTNWEGEI